MHPAAVSLYPTRLEGNRVSGLYAEKDRKPMFISGYETTQAYQPKYLQERAQAYQDAYADGELIVAWLGRALSWLGSWLVAWGQALQPRQNPRQSWVS